MNRSLKYFCTVILWLSAVAVFSQEEEHHCHDHHKNELGVANTIVFLEDASAYGLHMHYVRKVKHTRFGYGIGYEKVFDEHGHNTIGLIAAYHPIESLHINLIPGFAFEETEISEAKFTYHVEVAYSFDIANFHLGPVVGYASDFEHSHMSAGIHLGYGF